MPPESLCWKVSEYAAGDGTRNWTEYAVEEPSGRTVCLGVKDRDTAESIAALPMLKRAVEDHDRRSDRDPQIGAAVSLVAILAELRHIRAALGSGSVPSVELSVDSKALVKPVVKVYDADPERANQETQRIFDDLVIKYGGKSG